MKTRTLLALCALPLLQVSQAQEPSQRPNVVPKNSWNQNPAPPGTIRKQGISGSYQLGVAIKPGAKLIVQFVMDDSPAKTAGIQVNDEILDLNGIQLSNFHALQSILSAAGTQELKLTLKRGEEQLTLPVTPRIQVSNDNRRPPVVITPGRIDLPQINRRPQGDPKVEQLLGEILSEMKKMNQREDNTHRPAPTLNRVPTVNPPTQLDQPIPQPRRRVVLPPKNGTQE